MYLLFLDTWHRNNWMAIVQTNRKRYSTVLVNIVQRSPEDQIWQQSLHISVQREQAATEEMCMHWTDGASTQENL